MRRGAGALITSLYARPLEVWSRFVLRLNADHCGGCRICTTICPYDAISISPGATTAKIDLEKCQACGLCYSACPAGAIESGYYDFASLARNVQSSVRANGYKAIALTCRGSTPAREEIEEILGVSGFVPICLPCVGRTPPEFFLKALTMGIERIAVIPCQDDHCRFQDGSRISRSRFLLMQSLLQELNYDPGVLIFREAEGPIATVDEDLCAGCGTCIGICPYGAIRADGKNGNTLFVAKINPDLCQGCGLCAANCPSRAIEISRFADPQMIAQIDAALTTGPQGGNPRVLGFRCNWCSYEDDDLPFDRLCYSSQNIEVIGVPCVGRVDPLHVLWAFLNGADGIFLGGCPPGDCRYVSGSDQVETRFTRLQELLDASGFDSRRLRMEWFKRGSSRGYSDVIRSFASDIRKLGTTPIH
jgi:coenzyme F420-reducing hydrogenase delta subunit/Pyruvate/2-oxoacid:ferredoxin oxidoreductase delta subunit